jgi:hypothetical protein
MYVQYGHTLQTHDDVPKDIREELYAEEQQSHERHQKSARTSTASQPPININVLPAPSCQTCHQVSSPARTPAPDMPSKYTPINRLNIPGFQDDAVKEYCAMAKDRKVRKRANKPHL